MSMACPVIRQWFVVARKDKVLLPPAQAMLDFLSANGAKFLPRAAAGFASPAPPPAQAKVKALDQRPLRRLASPTSAQISASACTRCSISSSEWCGDGVMRSRSVPRGTVG